MDNWKYGQILVIYLVYSRIHISLMENISISTYPRGSIQTPRVPHESPRCPRSAAPSRTPRVASRAGGSCTSPGSPPVMQNKKQENGVSEWAREKVVNDFKQ